MKAADVMTSKVITVGPDAQLEDVARTLLSNRISGMPVLDADGKLIGIVSEGDLMRHVESGTERHRSWWLTLLMGRDALAAEYVKEHARKVSDVMTRDVIAVKPDTPLGDIATVLERNGIKRVPVVQDGKVVGIVSRANLLQALASYRAPIEGRTPGDAAIRESVMARIDSEPWGRPALINVIVQDGNVELWGIVETQVEKKAVRVAAEVTPGVRAVSDNLIVRPIESGI